MRILKLSRMRPSLNENAYKENDSGLQTLACGLQSNGLRAERSEALGHTGVAGSQIRECREVSVGSPEFGDAVLLANRRDSGIVHARPSDFGSDQQRPKDRPVISGFTDQVQPGALQPCFDLVNGNLDRGRWVENPRMGNDTEELMQARPCNGPGGFRIGQRFDPIEGNLVERTVLPMRVHQDVGVNRNHPAF